MDFRFGPRSGIRASRGLSAGWFTNRFSKRFQSGRFFYSGLIFRRKKRGGSVSGEGRIIKGRVISYFSENLSWTSRQKPKAEMESDESDPHAKRTRVRSRSRRAVSPAALSFSIKAN